MCAHRPLIDGAVWVLAILSVCLTARVAHGMDVLLAAPATHRARFASELQAVQVRVLRSSVGEKGALPGLRSEAATRRCSVLVLVADDGRYASLFAQTPGGGLHHRHLPRRHRETIGSLALRVAEFVDAWRADRRRNAAKSSAALKPTTPQAGIVLSAPKSASRSAPKTAPKSAPLRSPLRTKASAAAIPSRRLTTSVALSGASVASSPGTTGHGPASVARSSGQDAAVKETLAAKTAAIGSTRREASGKSPAVAKVMPVRLSEKEGVRSGSARSPAVSVRAGPSIAWDFSALRGGGQLRIGVAASVTERLQAIAFADVPVDSRSVANAAGVTTVKTWLAALGLSWRLLRWSRLTVHGDAGFGLAVTDANGRPSQGWSGHRQLLVSAAGWLGSSARVRLTPRWSIGLELVAVGLNPQPAVVVDGQTAARWGAPTTRFALTLEVTL